MPRTTVTSTDNVAGFFEIHTTTAHNAVVELAILPINEGFLRRLGIGREPDRRLGWTEGLKPVGGVVSRTLALDLVAVPPGDYDIVLTVQLTGGESLSSVRRIVIADR